MNHEWFQEFCFASKSRWYILPSIHSHSWILSAEENQAARMSQGGQAVEKQALKWYPVPVVPGHSGRHLVPWFRPSINHRHRKWMGHIKLALWLFPKSIIFTYSTFANLLLSQSFGNNSWVMLGQFILLLQILRDSPTPVISFHFFSLSS